MSAANREQRLTLRDIMLRRYLRLGESHTLSEVMGFLTDARFAEEGTPFLVVIGTDGNLAGLLEPGRIFAALLEGSGGPAGDEPEIARVLRANLARTMSSVMTRGVPALPPGAFLEEALLCIAEAATEVVAVTEGGRVIGLVTARILFEQASRLTVGALSGGIIPPARP